jgi:alanine dehydrogenase
MRVGVPKEIKVHEYRVGLTPASVAELTAAGHQVFVETGAGNGIDCPDKAYIKAGAEIVPDAAAVFKASDMIVKVKEPQQSEIALLEARHILFTYLHLAADKPQAEGLMKSGATCIAYETVTSRTGALPLLKPMSEVAGRMSVQVGAHYLEKEQGGRGVLLAASPVSPRRRSRSSAAAFPASTPRKWRPVCAPTSPSTTSTMTAWPSSTCSSRARSRPLMRAARRSLAPSRNRNW